MKEFGDDIKLAIEAVKKGGVIVYPTDTIWGIGCDATNVNALKKIISMKKRDESKSFIILLDHESKLLSYVKDVPDQAWMLIEHTERPLTIIYEGAKNLPQELIAADGTIGIRITRDPFCRSLIAAMRKPLVSTSANISGSPPPSYYSQIESEIIESADYVVQHRQNDNSPSKPSIIIRLKTNGQIEFIRR